MEFADLALELKADERALRRAVADGTIHCERLGPRRRRVSEDERLWQLTIGRCWPSCEAPCAPSANVRLAVLYGSVARGEDTPQSDVDLLVALAEDRPDAAVKLAVRLERALGRRVDVARPERVRDTAPLLLLRAIDEGRALIDRDAQWAQLRERRGEIARRATRAHAARRRVRAGLGPRAAARD
jgi:predicted nucleotidyltransferase